MQIIYCQKKNKIYDFICFPVLEIIAEINHNFVHFKLFIFYEKLKATKRESKIDESFR